MTLMNPDVKASWIAALRSGEYEQGLGVLRSNDNKYCCLGVLCNLAAKAGIGEWSPGFVGFHRSAYSFLGTWSLLPPNVMAWSGIRTPNGEFGLKQDLAYANDSGFSFTEIADIIEANF